MNTLTQAEVKALERLEEMVTQGHNLGRTFTETTLYLPMAESLCAALRRLASAGDGWLPEVVAWRAAEQKRIEAIAAYNEVHAFVKAYEIWPGRSLDREYQAMNAADKEARALLRPMYDALTAALPPPQPTPGDEQPEGAKAGECPECSLATGYGHAQWCGRGGSA